MARLLATRAVVAAKIESTYGNDPTVAGANAVTAMNLTTPSVDVAINEVPTLKSYAINAPHVPGKHKYTVSFDVPLAGSGTLDTAPEISPLLQACSFAETVNASTSVVYTPDVTDEGSCTIEVQYDNQRQFQLTGCRGTYSLAFDEVGGLAIIRFEMTGFYNAPSDTAFLSSLTYDGQTPLTFMGGTFTWGGGAVVLRSLSLDVGAEIAEIDNFTASTGYQEFRVTKFAPGGSMKVDMDTVANHPMEADLVAGTSAAIDMSIGSSAGNQYDIDLPACVIESVSPSEEGGVLVYDIAFKAYDSSGNDFLTLTHK